MNEPTRLKHRKNVTRPFTGFEMLFDAGSSAFIDIIFSPCTSFAGIGYKFMSTVALLLALLSAFLHASWNAIIKGANEDRAASMGLLVCVEAIGGALMLCIYGIPWGEPLWYAAASVAVHVFYIYFLLLAYETADLSVVYPIARGLSPIIIALGGFLLAGEHLSWLAWLTVVLVSVGILSPPLVEQGRSLFRNSSVGFSLLCGCTIAVYSLIDGLGVRMVEHPMSYIGSYFLGQGVIGLFLLIKNRSKLMAMNMRSRLNGVIGGTVSFTAYCLALYAATLAPLGMVSAVRESSVVMAVLLGFFFLGENYKMVRFISAVVVFAGLAVLGFSG